MATSLEEGMFVARVQGKSMEAEIADGVSCLFRPPRPGSRQGRRVRVTLKPLILISRRSR